MAFTPKFYFDENLRDVPENPEELRHHVMELQKALESVQDPAKKVSLLGEIGVYLRCLGDLDEAEEYLLEALDLVGEHQLGIKKEVQQMLRLAHVLQWQGDFSVSTKAFEQIIDVCRQDEEANVLLDFALQHAGKNLFDQEKYFEALELFYEALEIRKGKAAPQEQVESTEFAILATQRKLRKK